MKTKPKIDKLRRYENWGDFFDLDGSAVMRLTKVAAGEVCARASSQGRMVVRIEGGAWLDPYFEARGDCIWDGLSPPASLEAAERSNAAAQDFVRKAEVDVFILTAPPMSGWS